MKRKDTAGWMAIGRGSLSFWNDAAWVIVLRLTRMARGGPSGTQEAVRMVAEKLPAHAEFMAQLASGKAGRSPREIVGAVLRHYAPGVRANRQRLASADRPNPNRQGRGKAQPRRARLS